MFKVFSDEEKNSPLLLAVIIAWGCVLVGYHFAVVTGGPGQMLLIYGFTGFGLLLTLLLYRLLLRFLPHNPLSATVSSKPAAGAIVLLAFICMVASQAHRSITEVSASKNEVQNAGFYLSKQLWFNISWVWSVAFCLGFFVFVFSFYQKEKECFDYRLSLPAAIIYLVSAVLIARLTYAPNVLNNDSFHMIAALQTVYNTAYDTPFTIQTTGVYGHYAIFFWPFLKIFGHKPQTIAVMISAVSFLSQLLLLYTLHYSVKSDIIRILGALASVICRVLTPSTVYLQLWPLRIFPSVLILAYITYSHTHANPRKPLRRIVIGYGLCACAITFAADVGLVSTIVYAAWLCCRALKENAVFSRAMGRLYLITLCGCAGAVLGSVAIINLYNIVICHGQPILGTCFFPMIGGDNAAREESFFEENQIMLPKGNFSWIWVMALFFVGTIVGCAGTRLLPCKCPKDGELLFASALMGLGVNFYYLHRAAYCNLYIVIPEAVLCMAFLVDWMLRRRKTIYGGSSVGDCLRTGAALAVLLEFTTLAAVTLLFGSTAIETQRSSGCYYMDSMAWLAEQVEERVPKDTYAYGQVVQELYAYLDWDPGYHLQDPSSIAAGQGGDPSAIREEINSQESLLIYNDSYNLAMLDPDIPWIRQFGIPAVNPIVYYYVRQ